MAQKWNLGDIVPPERERKTTTRSSSSGMGDVRRQTVKKVEQEEYVAPERTRRTRNGASKAKLWTISILAIAVIVGGSFFLMALLGGAEVTVYPKFKDVDVSATVTGKINPGSEELGYELLTLTEEGERQVTASGQQQVSEQAQGTITIYNAYSTGVQRLIKNTRFESADGHIFRISDSVEVPGYTKNSDGSTKPGSIAASVFADGPGEEYNVAAGRFTVPGLKGSEQFEKIYAESSQPMSGGFEGLKYAVEESEMTTVTGQLQEELKTKLTDRLKNERPNGFILYDSSVVFDFETLPASDAGNGTVVVKVRGTLYAPLFANGNFASYLAHNTIAGYEGEPVRIDGPESLTFAYGTSTPSLQGADSAEFKLSGDARIVWTYDQEQLRNDLKGLEKTALPTVLSGYPAISRAEAVVKPFWNSAFPGDPEDIKITEVVGTPE